MAWLMRAVTGLARLLTLPLLRGLGGVLLTLTIPTLRALAAVCLVVAAVALASDAGTTTGGRGTFQSTTVLTHWQSLAPTSLEGTKTFLTKKMRPWVWDAASAPLRLPAFAFFAGLGLFFGYLGRHRRQVEIFVN